MSIKVLVFESDAAFAGELRNELGKLGCSTCVVDDGTVGLQQASAERPDLILLSIELPRMNGFSVCNKLKKDPTLKNVPLIIMSSESSDETFEQHRKLRTRAEDYVHKPIAFGELLQHIRTFVPMDDPVNDTSDVDGIVIDDEISVRAQIPDLEEGTVIGTRPMPGHAPPRHVDADIDAFTESAFGRMQEPARHAEPPPTTEQLNGAHEAVQTRPPPPTSPATALAGGLAHQSVRPTRPPPPAEDPEKIRLLGDLDRVTARVSELETDLASANERLTQMREEADAEGERKQREIDELKTRAAQQPAAGAKPVAGGVSTREFLDLREALNKKDKEILALKESVSSRDREIFEARDKSLAIERTLAEAEEKILAKDHEFVELREKMVDLGARFEASQAALSELQAGFDKTSSELKATSERLAEEQSKRKGEAAAHEAAQAELREDLTLAATAAAETQAAHKAELEEVASRHDAQLEETRGKNAAQTEALRGEHEEALASAKSDADAQRAQAVAAREKELRAETDSKLAALHRAHQDELSRTRNELTQQTEVRENELSRKHAEELEGERATAQARVAEAEQNAAAELARAQEQFEARLADAQATAAVAHEKTAEVGQKLDEASKELQDLGEAKRRTEESNAAKIADLEARLGKVEADRESLQREGAEAGDRIGALEAQLAAEGARLQKARAKWDADRGTLERAKDALAVALSQIDEVEARPIEP